MQTLGQDCSKPWMSSAYEQCIPAHADLTKAVASIIRVKGSRTLQVQVLVHNRVAQVPRGWFQGDSKGRTCVTILWNNKDSFKDVEIVISYDLDPVMK